MTQDNPLLSPLQVGELKLRNRVVMSPLTRARAEAGHLPGALMAEYYAQRADAGLIISECTMTAVDGSAFVAEPGIYTAEQVAAWKRVTDAVHARGGLIALQIWHPGRATHPYNNGGAVPVSSTDRAIADGSNASTAQGPQPYPAPRRLDDGELAGIVELFREMPKPLLLHCKSGADRAGLVSAIYLLTEKNAPVDEAIHELRFWPHGHVRQAKTGILDHFLDTYREHYRAHGTAFMDWIEHHYRQAVRDSFHSSWWANRLVDGILRRE